MNTSGYCTVYAKNLLGVGLIRYPFDEFKTVHVQNPVPKMRTYVEGFQRTRQNTRTTCRERIRPVGIPSDELNEVTQAFRRGEVWAFRRAAEEYFAPITNFLVHLVSNLDTAQDLAQEAFFAAFRSHETFREGSPIAPWIFRIARNLAYKELNRRSKRPKTSLDDLAAQEGYEPRADEPSPHDESADRDLKERINRALARIKPDFRDAVILRFVQGYSGEETAALLGIPLSTVNTRVHRGIRQLRKTLKREGIDKSYLLK
ncbi:MAG: sigma-70 family RNA polymerase sigma factor [bacterium]